MARPERRAGVDCLLVQIEVAEFERSMIRERVNAGLARARANGVKLGRPPVAPKIEQRIRDLRAQGMGLIRIGRELGIGTGTVQRVVAAG